MTRAGYRTYLLILIVYLIGLWGMSIPLTGDQKVYLSVALEMRERSEWVIPYLFGVPNFLKPPLQYWATLLGWKIFGLSLFGAMLPSVLALVASAILTNHWLRSRNGLAGLFFAASIGTMTYGTTAQMEIWIVLFYLWAWVEWQRERPYRALGVVGVMAWIKGPLYPALWVISAAGDAWIRKREWNRRWIGALALGIAVGIAWYALAANSQWEAMRRVFFERENLGKIQTSQGSPIGLWAEFLYTLLPWSPALLLAIFNPEARALWKERRAWLLSFGLLPAIFFTVFPYRVNTYLYLLTPLFAWMASTIDEVEPSPRERRARLVLVGYLVVLSAVLSVVALRLAQGGWIGYEIAGLVVLNLLLWNFFFIRRAWVAFGWICLLLVNLIRLGAVQIGETDLLALRQYQESNPASRFGYWLQEKDIWHEFGLVSAAIRQDIERIDESGLEEFVKQSGVLLLSEDQQAELDRRALPLECSPWPRIKRRLKFPFKKLVREGLPIHDSEVLRLFLICKARH